MGDALTYALAAPFITVLVALLRSVVPEIQGRWALLAVVVATVLWGGLLVASGRFAGDPAEFALATVTVASAAIGLAGVTSTLAPDDSTAARLT